MYEKDKTKKIYLIEKALSESKDIEDLSLIPIHINAGATYHEYYMYDQELEQYVEALRLSTVFDNEYYKYIIFNNIAQLKEAIGKHSEALELHKKCLVYEREKKIKDSLSIMISEINVAESMRYNKKYDSASYYYTRILNKSYAQYKKYGYIDIAIINIIFYHNFT